MRTHKIDTPAVPRVKKRLIQHFSYPKDIDQEMVPLLDVINSIPGVRTMYCCCGHGKESWYLSLSFTSIAALMAVEHWFDPRHTSNYERLHSLTESAETCTHYVYTRYRFETTNAELPEYTVAFYSEELGMTSASKRKQEIKRMCKYFSNFVPVKHW